MNQFKPAQIIMLHTKKASNILVNKENNLVIVTNYYTSSNPQHLYIISDDEIKEGNWVLCLDETDSTVMNWNINQCIFKHIKGGNCTQCKKVIATTDTSLHIPFVTPGNEDLDIYEYSILPEIPEQFIEQYIEEYNKGNIITDVLVEYETYQDTINYHKDIWKNFERIKTNPKDNSITIKKLKNNWNREEIVEFGEKIREYCKNGYKSGSLHKVFYEWDKWIEENL